MKGLRLAVPVAAAIALSACMHDPEAALPAAPDLGDLLPAKAIPAQLDQLRTALLTNVADVARLVSCDKGLDATFPRIWDTLAQSTEGDLNKTLEGLLGAWAYDPAIRLAVAVRLEVLRIHLEVMAPGDPRIGNIPNLTRVLLTPDPSNFAQLPAIQLLLHTNDDLLKLVNGILPIAIKLDPNAAPTLAPLTPLAQSLQNIVKSETPLEGTAQGEFTTVLLGYLRAYFSNKFVNRFGTAVAFSMTSSTSMAAGGTAAGTPTKGIPDAEISGATTVMVEALFDFFERTPIVIDPTDPANPPKPWKPNDGTPQPTFKQIWGGSGSTIPTALTVLKQESGKDIYGTVPTISTVKDDPGATCGVTPGEARALVTLSNLFGHRAVVWSGALSEMLSSINLGTLFAGTSFAIGDNKTLVEIFKAAVEASARRSAEQILFRVFYDTSSASFGHLIDYFPEPSKTGGAGGGGAAAGGADGGGGGAAPAATKKPTAGKPVG